MSRGPSVAHVLPRLSRGGGSRCTINCITAAGADAQIISLREAEPELRDELAGRGIALLDAPGREQLAAALAAADIVQVDFWNSPELYELLCGELPPCRLAVWLLVGGDGAPQVVTDELVEFADRPINADVAPGRGEIDRIGATLDGARLEAVASRPHEGFVVGYIGTVAATKMHPDFVALCAAVGRDDARFVVCGSGDGFGAIAAESERLGIGGRFELRGWVDDVGAELAGFDVFGYPLRADNYSTAELVLQEAMLAGVPPVVLPYGGGAGLVEDGRSGIVAADEREYSRAIERLGADPELRRTLGAGARERAHSEFSPAVAGRRWAGLYGEMLQSPKRSRRWPGPEPRSGAELFIAALGARSGPFAASLRAEDGAAGCDADERIRASSPPLVLADGGVLDYRRRFPDDAHLRLWAGLVLEQIGRPALAAGELQAAARLGIDPVRVEPRLAALTGALA